MQVSGETSRWQSTAKYVLLGSGEACDGVRLWWRSVPKGGGEVVACWLAIAGVKLGVSCVKLGVSCVSELFA